jgi:hypothetical protein
MIQIPITDGQNHHCLSSYASTRVYAREAVDGWILSRSYLGSHMYVMIPVNVSMILQSMTWWIFREGIPHTTWCVHVLGS